jgi:hypothetical protein
MQFLKDVIIRVILEAVSNASMVGYSKMPAAKLFLNYAMDMILLMGNVWVVLQVMI